MKRLLQISFDTLLLSIIPIVIWNALGLILTKDLVITFSVTYPIQFLFYIFYYIFAVGPNITAEKKKNNDIVYSNVFLGTFIGILTLLILIFECNNFISIMNVDVSVFRTFTIYSMFNIFYSYVLKLILEKLYYDKKNKKANLISILFNIINLILIIVLALITKNQHITSVGTIIVMGVILFAILLSNIKKFKFNISIIDNIKNSSIGIVENVLMFIIYFFGQINSYSFGMEYILASTFVGIISDTQWDMIYAIQTTTHIDVSKGNFSFKEHLKNGYKLSFMLILSSIIMSFILYKLYNPNIVIFLIYFSVQVIFMLFFPVITIRQHYLQIKSKETNTNPTLHSGIAKTLRTLCSFIHNPFCTYIGQIVEMLYNYIYTKIVSRNIFEIK